PALIEIAFHEALHVRHAGRTRVATKDLQIDRWKMMVGIGIELTLKLCMGQRPDGRARCVRIAELVADAVDPRVNGLQGSQHVVEGTVLHHQNDDVLQIVESRGHSRLHSRCLKTISLSGLASYLRDRTTPMSA